MSNGKAPEARTSARRQAAAAPRRPQARRGQGRVERSRRTLVALGEVVSVLMKSPEHRAASLATVQMMVAAADPKRAILVLTAHDRRAA